ncbi:MAG: YkgJ family cysteine cluster protein [Spirochaetia bacterium]|nr:YkgJ family cysteine cluster protein [Spirochaetia bacterium]
MIKKLDPRLPQFSCTQSGKCCRFRGEDKYVFLYKEDIRKIAAHLGMTQKAFRKTHVMKVERHNSLIAKGRQCVFLKNNLCSIHTVKPEQCASWPYWDENIVDGKFVKDVQFCPGIKNYQKAVAKKEV